MKVGAISQWYEPETGSGGHPTMVARALSRLGHEVSVLTGFPNYPTGRIYPGYRQSWRQREVREGVEVTRVPLWPSHDASACRRVLGLSSFAVSAATQAGTLRDCDVCLVYLSPATVALPAVVLKKRATVPYVLYVQDLWPDTVLHSGFIGNERASDLAGRVINRILAHVYDGAAQIAVIAPGMKELLIERGVSPSKITVVPNWVDEDVFRPTEPDELTSSLLDRDSFWLMYAGSVGELQGLQTAIQAIAKLSDQPAIKLAIVGEGVALPKLEKLVSSLGLQRRVVFLPARPLSAMSSTLSAADTQLISLRDVRLFEATIPSKLQASMACGQPVVVSAPGDAAAIAQKSACGLACRPEDPEALAHALVCLAARTREERRAMGEKGRRYYQAHMSEAAGARALGDLLALAQASRTVAP